MYRSNKSSWLKHFDFLVLDLICLGVAFLLAFWVRLGFENPFRNELYRNLGLLLMTMDVMSILALSTFSKVRKRGYYLEFVATIKHDGLLFLLVLAFLFIAQVGTGYSRMVLILTVGFHAMLSYIVRVLWKRHLSHKFKKDEKRQSLVIVTERDQAEGLIDDIRKDRLDQYYIVGMVLADGGAKQVYDVPVVATLDTMRDFVCREWVDEVFISLPKTYEGIQDYVNDLVTMGVTVHWELAETSELQGKLQMDKLGGHVVLVSTVKMAGEIQLLVKRFMDICGGLVGCLIAGVLFVIVGPMIYIKSPGPILFSQIRIGKNGRKFKIYKFRSMYLDAEERKKELMSQNRVKDGMMFKMDWDPRIIGSEKGPGKGLGNFIRKYSIDEWPQFFNILVGDMSLVGTRPPTVDEWEKYEMHHRARMAAKPGLTGMWQVSGRSAITDFEEVVALDMKYITEWNIGLDIKILFKTVFAVIGKKGSM